MTGPEIKALRDKLGLSQTVFAQRYLVNWRSLQEWESGRREPDQAARTLLLAISRAPLIMAQILAGAGEQVSLKS